MAYKREHRRVPLTASATLVDRDNLLIHSRTVNLSIDGMAVSGLPRQLEQTDYRVELKTRDDHGSARFGATLIHQENGQAGFQITSIDGIALKHLFQIYYQNC